MNRFLALLAATMIGALLSAAAYITGSLSMPANAAPGTLHDNSAPSLVKEVIRDHPVVHGVIAKATGRRCQEEDSINCFWNARTMGNGQGHSFYSVRVGGRDCIIYWNARYNKAHGHCI